MRHKQEKYRLWMNEIGYSMDKDLFRVCICTLLRERWGKDDKVISGNQTQVCFLSMISKNILFTLTFNNNAFFVAVVVIVIVTSSVRMNSQCLKCETNCLLITRIETSNNIWLQFLTRNQEPSRTFLS